VLILLAILFFSSLVQIIPMAFIAGMLMFVSINMVNFQELKTVIRISRSETALLFLTMLLTVLTDLVFAIQVGFLFAVLLIFIKLTRMVDVSSMEEYDSGGDINIKINSDKTLKDKVSVYTIHGPFFFGAMDIFDRKIDEHVKVKSDIIIIRMKHVPFIDSTAIARFKEFIKKKQKENRKVFLTGLAKQTRKSLFADKEFVGLIGENASFNRVRDALEYSRKILSKEK